MRHPKPMKLLREVIDYAETARHEWDQSTYGTRKWGNERGCLAFLAIKLSGNADKVQWRYDEYTDTYKAQGIFPIAREILGLTHNEMSALTAVEDLTLPAARELRKKFKQARKAAKAQNNDNDNEAYPELKELRGMPLLKAVIQHIRLHPESFDATTFGDGYSDGTEKGCVAFHACKLTDTPIDWIPATPAWALAESYTSYTSYANTTTTRDKARALYGLTEHEADRLFSATVSIDDIHRYYTDFKNARKANK